MQKNVSLLITLLVICVSASSCEVVGGIFKAGVWTGFIVYYCSGCIDSLAYQPKPKQRLRLL
jgi:hypothetical protein